MTEYGDKAIINGVEFLDVTNQTFAGKAYSYPEAVELSRKINPLEL